MAKKATVKPATNLGARVGNKLSTMSGLYSRRSGKTFMQRLAGGNE